MTIKKKTNEGLSELAVGADADHEVQMARADLYNIADQAIKLHGILKHVSEEQGLEGWQQAKITKAADYINSVFTALSYRDVAAQPGAVPMVPENKKQKPSMSEAEVNRYKSLLEKAQARATRRIQAKK